MPRFKRIDSSPRFLAVALAKRFLPGSFAFAVDRKIRIKMKNAIQFMGGVGGGAVWLEKGGFYRLKITMSARASSRAGSVYRAD